jgi:CRP/FNR family cyclic AMP-dependent transcriptional regulator
MTRAAQTSTSVELPPADFRALLGKADLETLRDFSRTLTFRKSEHLFPAGKPPQQVMAVLSGRVKTGVLAEDGREVVTSILYKGDMLGESGVWPTDMLGPFAVALDKQVEVLVFDLEDFRRLLARLPALARHVLETVGEKLRQAETRNRALLFNPARKRVVDCLKQMIQREGIQIGYEILLRNCPTHQDLADLAGTSRQTVTSILNELRQRKLLHVDRKNILIRDVNALD